MYFVVQYRARQDSAGLRAVHHPAHVQFRKGLGSRVLLAGPLLAPDGGEPIGSLLIFAAASPGEAADLAASDPLCVQDVYDLVSITPFRPMAFHPPHVERV